MKTVILDFGHGGVLNGDYQTAGKRSPVWKNGTQYFEGVGNRIIGNHVVEGLALLNIPFLIVSDQQQDNSLDNRCIRANHFYDTVSRDCFLVSLHSNAGGGRGFEAYTAIGGTMSDEYATVFYDFFEKDYPKYKCRCDHSDGDPDKEAMFTILKKTKMPAVLLEYFFMDNEYECKNILMTDSGRRGIAKSIVKAIATICSM